MPLSVSLVTALCFYEENRSYYSQICRKHFYFKGPSHASGPWTSKERLEIRSKQAFEVLSIITDRKFIFFYKEHKSGISKLAWKHVLRKRRVEIKYKGRRNIIQSDATTSQMCECAWHLMQKKFRS